MTSKKNFYIVLVGIDGSGAPNQILRDCMNAVEQDVSNELGIGTNDVYVDVRSQKADQEQIETLGDRTMNVHQYDIGVDLSVDTKTIESTVANRLRDLGFNVTGTEVKKVENKTFYHQ